MKAVFVTKTVRELVTRPIPTPEAGEVLIKGQLTAHFEQYGVTATPAYANHTPVCLELLWRRPTLRSVPGQRSRRQWRHERKTDSPTGTLNRTGTCQS